MREGNKAAQVQLNVQVNKGGVGTSPNRVAGGGGKAANWWRTSKERTARREPEGRGGGGPAGAAMGGGWGNAKPAGNQ